jgi:hypothetical protein
LRIRAGLFCTENLTAVTSARAGTLISGAVVEFTATSNLFIGCSLSGILITILSWLFTDVRHVETLYPPEEPRPDDKNPNELKG